MKRGVYILIFALLLATTAFCGYRWLADRDSQTTAARADDEMEWLRREFALGDEEFGRIAAMHADYRPKCDALCAAVVAANSKLDAAIDENGEFAPAVATALREVSEVEEECRRTMLGHIYAVSAEMKPEAGRRYIAMMKPRIVQSAEAHHRTMTLERR